MMQFERYDTILSDGDLIITDIRWNGGELGVYYAEENVTFEEKPDESFPQCELYLVVFDHTTKSLYRIEFSYMHGYRLLDEGGLLGFWGDEGYNHKKLGSIIKLINSPWSKESEIPFISSGYQSYLIATENECVEVITNAEPIIHFLKKLEPKAGNHLPWS